jgi:two-component sensor histidine kinase
MVEDRAGTLWVASDVGLQSWRDGRFRTVVLRGVADWITRNILMIREGRGGTLWLGTAGGLLRYQDGAATRYATAQGLSNEVINVLCPDGDDLWFVTEDGTLHLWRQERVLAFPLQPPAAVADVSALLDDGRSHLWLGSARGIVRLNKDDLLRTAAGTRQGLGMRLFDRLDGLRTTEITGQGATTGWKDPDGRLWFTSARGLVMIDPSAVRANLPPPARIERVLVNQRETPVTDPLELPPRCDQLEIEYTALDLLTPRRTRFRYQLEGSDHGWKEAGTRRVAIYTHLPGGQYRFLVQAANDDGAWDEQGAALAVYVRPHVYETYWFYGLCALGLLLAGLGLHRLRTRRMGAREQELRRVVGERTRDLQDEVAERRRAEQKLREHQEHLEEQVAQRTEEIRGSLREKEALLREVHHRVKNNLQLVCSLLGLQAAKVNDPAAAVVYTESLNRVRSMALVHENLYRAGKFSVVHLADHVKDLCDHLLRSHGIDAGRIELRTRIADVPLDFDRAMPCGLIVNELVSNALKYAFPDGRSGWVSVELRGPEGGAYVLRVADNGVGLPPGFDVGSGDTLGLQLVADLTDQLGGTLTVQRGEGTGFTITFPAG